MNFDPKRLNPRLNNLEHLERCKLNNCRAACCFDGVWVDKISVDRILENADLISPFLNSENQDPSLWFDERIENDEYSLSGQVIHSTVIPDKSHYMGTACIFLRTDYKCALQVATTELEIHPWKFKPFYCILHPLIIDSDGKITIDTTESLANETGSCLRPSPNEYSLLDVFSEELKYLLGEK